jgi:L-rhamnose mutarotase
MTIKTRALGALAGLFAFVAVTGAAQAADRPYTEGPVSMVSSIRTEPGMFQTYMKYLSTTYKSLMEEQKKAGIILDYAVYQTTPRSPDDPDLYLVVTYKNMAAMDGLADRTDAIQEKLIGNQEQRDAAIVARGKMRTSVGSEMIRKLDLK